MPKVLVVDDEPSVRELIATLLGLEGYDVAVAEDGEEALAACERDVPDVIVLDLAMPNMDGWHFLDELYRHGLRKRTRVVIVSAWIDEEGHGIRARHKLAKPFVPDALLRMVADALSHEPDELYEQSDRANELSKLLNKIEQTLG